MDTLKIMKLLLTGLVLTFSGTSLLAENSALPNPTETQIQEALTSVDRDRLFNSLDFQHGIVIGTDDRVRYSSNQIPWKSIGKIRFGKNAKWTCSAVLVGPRHVLTNAHCVDLLFPVFFYPSYNNGDYLNKTPIITSSIWVYWGTPTAQTSSGTPVMGAGYIQQNDWAILILNKSVGTPFGWMTTHTWDNTWLNQSHWTNAGYPEAGALNGNGEYPLSHVGCSVRANISNYLIHDCDTGSGSSGSPIFAQITGQYTVVGLDNWHWGSGFSCTPFQVNICANGAVAADRFIPTLKYARTIFP